VVVGPLPLPVSGSVDVGNSPTVNLASGTSVVVGNAASNPVRVKDMDHAKQPVQAASSLSLPSGGGGTGAAMYIVPPLKTLVIEYASLSCGSLTAGASVVPTFATLIGGVTATHGLPIITVPAGSELRHGAMVRWYAEAGSGVVGGIFANSTANCLLTFSGHLVDS